MNELQRVVLTIGLVVVAAMCMVPPWEERLGILWGRLLLQVLAVAAGTGAAFVALGAGKRPAN